MESERKELNHSVEGPRDTPQAWASTNPISDESSDWSPVVTPRSITTWDHIGCHLRTTSVRQPSRDDMDTQEETVW